MKLSYDEKLEYESLISKNKGKDKFYYCDTIYRVAEDSLEALKLFNNIDIYGNCTLHPFIDFIAEGAELKEAEKIKVLDLSRVIKINNKRFFEKLINLKILIANNLHEFEDRSCLAHLSTLKYIELNSMRNVELVEPSSLRKLQKDMEYIP